MQCLELDVSKKASIIASILDIEKKMHTVHMDNKYSDMPKYRERFLEDRALECQMLSTLESTVRIACIIKPKIIKDLILGCSSKLTNSTMEQHAVF